MVQAEILISDNIMVVFLVKIDYIHYVNLNLQNKKI